MYDHILNIEERQEVVGAEWYRSVVGLLAGEAGMSV